MAVMGVSRPLVREGGIQQKFTKQKLFEKF